MPNTFNLHLKGVKLYREGKKPITTVCASPSSSLKTVSKRKEINVLFNDALNTFFYNRYLAADMVKRERNVLFNDSLNTFTVIWRQTWLRTILIVREETRCRHIGYSFLLAARVLLYAPSHRHDSTYHGLCYTSRGALAGTRNSSIGPPHEGSIRRPIAP